MEFYYTNDLIIRTYLSRQTRIKDTRTIESIYEICLLSLFRITYQNSKLLNKLYSSILEIIPIQCTIRIKRYTSWS